MGKTKRAIVHLVLCATFVSTVYAYRPNWLEQGIDWIISWFEYSAQSMQPTNNPSGTGGGDAF